MLLIFLLVGLIVADADIAMQKKTEVKSLLELANHHATFAIDQSLKTEGIIEMTETEALARLDKRMEENGGYIRQGSFYLPSSASITTDPLPFVHYYVNFQNWRKDLQLILRYTGDSLLLEKAVPGQEQPTGGELRISITTDEAQVLELSPKKMIGPSLVVVAYVDERPLTPLLPAHSFPVVSVEELKW
jgi:hypothetical protein